MCLLKRDNNFSEGDNKSDVFNTTTDHFVFSID